MAALTEPALFQGTLLGMCFCLVIAITVNTTGLPDDEIRHVYSSPHLVLATLLMYFLSCVLGGKVNRFAKCDKSFSV